MTREQVNELAKKAEAKITGANCHKIRGILHRMINLVDILNDEKKELLQILNDIDN